MHGSVTLSRSCASRRNDPDPRSANYVLLFAVATLRRSKVSAEGDTLGARRIATVA